MTRRDMDALGKILDTGAYLLMVFLVLRGWQTDARHLIALSISLTAFALWMLARRQLGASFTARAEARKLVTHGLYSKIRNPVYFFGFIAYGGALIANGWYIAFSIFVVFYALVQVTRVRQEEKVLSEAFGEEYRAYKARSWF